MFNRIFCRLYQNKNIIRMEIQKAEHTSQCLIEGQAEIRLKSDKVFYNPVQEFNRDISIAVLSVFIQNYNKEQQKRAKPETQASEQRPISILEALSATGLRSIRYAKEVPGINKVIANDFSKEAVETIKDNVIYNGVSDIVETSYDDACTLMYKHKDYQKRFTAVDLDPYGSPATFLDSAVQSVDNGGLLLVTATDVAILNGNTPETCYYKYGAVSLKTQSGKEMSLRILLQSIEHHANRYNRYIEPLLSLSIDFYIRVFVRIRTGPEHCKKTTSKLSMVYNCTGCDNIILQPLGAFKPNPTDKNPSQMKAYLPTVQAVGEFCIHCNQRHHLGGPIWSAPIHNESFVSELLEYVQNNSHRYGTFKRIQGVLSMVLEELFDVPTYYQLNKIFGRVHMENMSMLIMRSAILNAGYRVSYSHADRNSLKTDAPAQFLWDVVRTWAKTHPVKPARLESDEVARFILNQEIKHQVDLTGRDNADPKSKREKYLRFQTNPTPYWGPGSRANINLAEANSKAIRNQNKNLNKRKIQELETSTMDGSVKKAHSNENVENL